MDTGTGLFLLGVWISLAAAIASPHVTEIGYKKISRCVLLITAVVLAAVLLGNLYRL